MPKQLAIDGSIRELSYNDQNSFDSLLAYNRSQIAEASHLERA